MKITRIKGGKDTWSVPLPNWRWLARLIARTLLLAYRRRHPEAVISVDVDAWKPRR